MQYAKRSVLVSFPFSNHEGVGSIPLGAACVRSLELLGYKVFSFNTADAVDVGMNLKRLERVTVHAGRLFGKNAEWSKSRVPWLANYWLCRKFLATVADTRPEILIVISGPTYPEWVLREAKERYGVRNLIGWCIEGPTWATSVPEQAALYDKYFCIYKAGLQDSNVHHLPAVGFDPESYVSLGHVDKTEEMVFVGRQKPRRVKWLGPLKDKGLSLYGRGWDNTPLASLCVSDGVFGAELNQLYNRNKIVLNVSAWENCESDCLNLRVLDVPATGSMLLTDYAPGIAEYFVPNKEVVIAQTPEEMYDLACYYLSHKNERERIALAGWEKVQRLETYPQKMRRMLAVAGI